MKRTRRHHVRPSKHRWHSPRSKARKRWRSWPHNLAWRRSNTLTTNFCIEAVQEALVSYGNPDIFNTDQGCQFTSQEFTGLPNDHGIQICMGGTGCWRDNVFLERLWRSVPYICRPMTSSAPPVRAWGGT